MAPTATERANSAVSAALAGAGRVVLLTGEAGIGKTHLAELLFDHVRSGQLARAVWARAGRAGAPAFRPWIEILSELTRTDGPGSPAVGPRVAALLGGDLHSEPADLRSRFELFDDIASTLAARAQQQPVLVVLDDLHLADSASLLLTAHLAPMLRDMPLALVATVRDDVTPDRPEWVGAWGELVRSSVVVAVPPLGPDAIAAMVLETSGRTATPDEIERISGRTGGNALFVRELISLGHEVGSTAVPDTLRAVVTARVARLPAECRQVLGLASVIGTVVPMTVLTETVQTPLVATLDLLEHAAADGLLARPDAQSIRFSHEIVRDAVYDGVPLNDRLRWHANVAAVLEQQPDPPAADIASHLSNAGPDHAADAAHWWERAGADAMALLAYEEAARCFEAALTTAGWDGRLRVRLGDARSACGDAAGARTAYLAAAATGRRAGDARILAHAALGLGSGPSGFEVTLLDGEQISALEDAVRMVPTEDHALRALLLARLSVALTFSSSPERRAQLAEEALALARTAGDDAALGVALASQCDVLAGPQHAHLRLSMTTQIIEIAVRLHDATLELLGRRMRIVARLELGDLAGFNEDVRAFATVAEALRQPLYRWYVPMWQAMIALYEERFDDCSRLLDEASAIASEAGSVNAHELIPTLRWCLACETDLEAVRELYRLLDELKIEAAWVPISKALSLAQLGDTAVGRRQLDLAAAAARALPDDGNWLASLCQLAEALGHLGAHPIAEWLYDALMPWADLFVVEGIGAGLRGSVQRHLAITARILGRDDIADNHFRRALEANEKLGLPLLVKQTLAAFGDRPDVSCAPRSERSQAAFVRTGDTWSLDFGGQTVSVRDSKGLRDLVRLLAEPGRPFAAVDLVGTDGRAEQGDLGEVVDAQARAAYQRRLAELDEEAADADALGDSRRSELVAGERDALIAQLSAAYGLAGRARHAGSTVERARTTVTARIRDSIKRIEAVHPALGRHLRAAVRTGTVCVYSPPEPVEWTT